MLCCRFCIAVRLLLPLVLHNVRGLGRRALGESHINSATRAAGHKAVRGAARIRHECRVRLTSLPQFVFVCYM